MFSEDDSRDATAERETGSFVIDPGPEVDTSVMLTGSFSHSSAGLGDSREVVDAGGEYRRAFSQPLESDVVIEILDGSGARPTETLVFPLGCVIEDGEPDFFWRVEVDSPHYVSRIQNENSFTIEVINGESDEAPGLVLTPGESRDVAVAFGGVWWVKLTEAPAGGFPACPIPEFDSRAIEIDVELKCLCDFASGCEAGSRDCCCGDGFLDLGEECDIPGGVGCSRFCTTTMVTLCGNGIVESGEECDPPDGLTCDDGCRAISSPDLAFCGNGVVEVGEECDPPDGETCGEGCESVAR